MKFLIFVFSLVFAIVSAKVHHLGANFPEVTATGVWFAKFYAPWCGHCKKLAPTWDTLSEKVESEDVPINIVSVDCTKHRDVCLKFEVKGYPTLIAFENGAIKEKYNKARTLDALLSFAKKVSEGATKVVYGDSSTSSILSDSSIKNYVLIGVAVAIFGSIAFLFVSNSRKQAAASKSSDNKKRK
eukprot:GDKK01046177.1.p1 GENE.GDKK01046177.1~~GDKK01046177.1.p1  ORF type:complete len:185 (+),score=38.84 GDKK01046177.1:24-578(+)